MLDVGVFCADLERTKDWAKNCILVYDNAVLQWSEPETENGIVIYLQFLNIGNDIVHNGEGALHPVHILGGIQGLIHLGSWLAWLCTYLEIQIDRRLRNIFTCISLGLWIY